MKRALFASALALLTSCAYGGLAGLTLGDRMEASNFGHIGTSVVCLGSSEGARAWDWVGEDGAFRVNGRVVSVGENRSQIGNVDSCWAAPHRVVVLEDAQGVRWTVGFRWQSTSLGEMTPTPQITEGETLDLLYRPGEVAGSAGFALFRGETLAFAMESGRGGAGLAEGDIPGLRVSTSVTAGEGEDECGHVRAVFLRFETDAQTGDESDTADGGEDLPPGGDAPLTIVEGGTTYTLCNINSVESDDEACADDAEKSWVIFGG